MDVIPNIKNPSILELNSLTDPIVRYIMTVNNGAGYYPCNSLGIREVQACEKWQWVE